MNGEDDWSMTLTKLSLGAILLQLWSSLAIFFIRRRVEHLWYTIYLLVSFLILPFTLTPFLQDYSGNLEVAMLLISLLSYALYWKFYGALFKIGRENAKLFLVWRAIMFLYGVLAGVIVVFSSVDLENLLHEYFDFLALFLLGLSCLIYYLPYPGRDRILVSVVVFGAFSSDIISILAANHLVEGSPVYGIRLHYISYAAECLFFPLALTYSARQVEITKAELEYNLLRERLNAMSNQMNMHFIANSLNAVYRFLLNQEGDAATFYFLKFSRLLRGVLHHSREEVVTVAQEVELLQLYLEMEALRFQHRFAFSIQVQEPVHAKITTIPPFLIQPLLENAIHHGLLPKKGEGNLQLRFGWEDNHLKITIEDNGIGRAAAALNTKAILDDKKSLGLSIVQERLSSLQANALQLATLDIHDLYDEEGAAAGTRAEITLSAATNPLPGQGRFKFPFVFRLG
jgi:signal transduction histidine kinase